VLAHQGGWDEILVVVGPMIVIGAVLAVVRRRVGPAVDDDTHASPLSDDGTE
jgi:hypothetical protein